MTKALALAFVFVLLVSIVAGIQLVVPVTANFNPFPPSIPSPILSVQSPENGSTYPELLPIKFTVIHNRLFESQVIYVSFPINFWIDGYPMPFPYSNIKETVIDGDPVTHHYSLLVDCHPSAGKHTLVIKVTIAAQYYSPVSVISPPIYFSIDAAPTISLLSPEPKIYNKTDVPLTFTISESVTWMAYKLDSQANVTITGNMTLTRLCEGTHNLTVYAKDTIGNTATSGTVHFTVHNQTEPNPPVQPQQSDQQRGFLGSALPMEYGYAIFGAVAAAITATTGYYFYKRRK